MKQKRLNRLLMLIVAFMTMSINLWGATFTKVTSTSSLNAGDEYIIVSGSSYAVTSSMNGSNGLSLTSVTETDGKISLSNESSVVIFTLGGSSSGYTLTLGTSYFSANGTGNKSRLLTSKSTSGESEFTISFDSDKGSLNLVTKQSSVRCLRANATTDVRFYSGSTSQNGVLVYLYKKNSETPTTITLSEAGEVSNVGGSFSVGGSYDLPTKTDATCDNKVLVGWSSVEIPTAGAKPISNYYEKGATVTLGATNTFYAVFADEMIGDPIETLSQTLQYDTWESSGSTTDRSTYRLFHSGSYIESASFDRSKLSKVIVYGGTFGGDSYNKLTIGDGTNTWKSVTVSGKSETGTNSYTNGTALSGNGTIRVTSNSGSASNTGVRISKVEIFTMEDGTTYSNYTTTCGPATYTASVSPAPENGSIKLSTDGSSFVDGPLEGLENDNKFYFTVTPEDGYQLKSGSLKVNDSGTGIEGPDANGVYSYTINNANAVVSAVFEQKPYSITVSYVGEGDMGIADFAATGENPRGLVRGASADIVAIVETGYEFVNWTVSPVGAVTFTNSEAEETSFTVSQTIDGAATITANFVALDVYGIKAYFEDGAEDEYQNFTMNNESRRYELAYTLPAGNKKFWVGTNAWSSNFSGNWEFGGRFTFGNGTNSYLGEGADVTLYIDPTKKNEANSNLDIKADFTYQVAFKSGETWTHLPFAQVEGDKYETEEVTISGAYFDGNWDYYVGAKKTDGGTTFIPNKSHKGTYGESSQANFLLKEVAGLTSNNGTVKGKFRIWANSTDRNWYCSFVPVYSYVMMNGDEIFHASEEISSEAGSLATTIFATEPVKAGYHFAGWSRTADKSTFDNENDMAAGADYTYWKYNDVLYPVWQSLYTILVGPESSVKGTATFSDETDSKELLSGTQVTITAAPLIGYVFDGWSTEGDITIEDASAETTTITVKEEDAMIVANFKDAPSHNAIWSVNGHETTVPYKEGLTIALAADPTENIPDGYVFKGWYEGDYENESVAPEYVTEPGTMAQADRTFKAVFAKETEVAGATYNLVESALTDYSGDFLIVYNNTYAMNTHSDNRNTNTFATYTDISQYYTEATKSIASNTTTDALVYRAAKTTNGYSLYSVSDESYLGITANTTSTGARLRWNTAYTESADDWTLGVGSVRNVGSNTLYIRWNNNSGSYRFAAYGSTGQQAVQLFKKPVRTETSNYCTSYTKMYDVKYVVDGEEDTDLAQEVAESTTPAAVAEPTKVGYTFNGWYAVPECTGEKVVPTGVTITEDKTFYGKFDVNNYAITLDKNGAAAADGSASVNYDATAVTTISHVAAWAGHELKGYYTATDNDEKVLNADGTFAGNVAGWIVDGKWAKAEAATLYAQWNVLANCSLGAELVGCTAAGENLAEVTVNTENVVLNYVLDANRTWTGATVTVTMGMETLVANTHYTFSNGVLTFSTPITGNVNVTISAPYAPATLTLSAIGNEYNHGENLKVTDEITLPTTANVLAAGKTFMGWSTVEIPAEGEAPVENFYAKGAQYTIASTTDKLYAVYATETPGAVSWNKVTAAATLTAGGTFIMGYDANNNGNIVPMKNTGTATIETEGYLYSGTADEGDATTINMSSVEGTDAFEVTIAASTLVDDAITIKAGNYYVGNENTRNNLKLYVDESEKTAFGVTIGDNSVFTLKIAGNENYHTLQYNTSSPRYAVYGGTQKNVVIYKKNQDVLCTKYTTSGAEAIDAPVFTEAQGTYTEAKTIHLTAADGATIYYTVDGTTPTKSSTEYADGIMLNTNGTIVIKAFAVKGEAESEVATATYIMNIPYTDIETLVADNPVDKSIQLNLTDAYVHAILTTGTGKLIYVQQGERGIVLSCTTANMPEMIAAGKALTAEVTGTYAHSSGRDQINSFTLNNASVAEGIRPEAVAATALNDELLNSHLGLVKIENVYAMGKDPSNSTYIMLNTQSDGEGTEYKAFNVLNAIQTLPENTLLCNISGLFYKRVESNNDVIYTIIPVLSSDLALVNPENAVLPTVSPAGGATAETAVAVPENQIIKITPADGYTTYYKVNEEAEKEFSSAKEITLTEATTLFVRATRPYYTEQTATYYYTIDPALNAYKITAPTVGHYTYYSEISSAVADELVTIKVTPSEHWNILAVAAAYNDGEEKSITATSIGENLYTFAMPAYDVQIKVTTQSDPTYSIAYQTGGKVATSGSTPVEGKKYAGDEVTLKSNTWTTNGFIFDSWKVVYTDAEEVEQVVTVTDNKFIMPAYDVKIIAQWTPVYAVTYAKGAATEATGSVTEKPQVEGAKVTLKANAFKAKGYTFIGWKASTDEQIYQPDEEYTMTAEAVTFTAQWDLDEYKKEGAWELVKSNDELVAGKYYVIACATQNVTLTANSAGTTNKYLSGVTTTFTDGETTGDKALIKNTDLPNTTVIFQLGGEDGAWTLMNVETEKYYHTGNNSNPEWLTKARAWETLSYNKMQAWPSKSYNDTTLQYNTAGGFRPYTSSQKAIQLYRFYPQAWKVSYDANDGIGAPAKHKADAATQIAVISDVEPTRTGYTFTGWTTTKSGTGAVYHAGDEFGPMTKDVTLYAQWTKTPYNVAVLTTENAIISARVQGEGTTIAEGGNADVLYEKYITLSYTDVDEDYFFNGWVVTKADDPETKVEMYSANVFQVPAYAVNVTANIADKASTKVVLTLNANGGQGDDVVDDQIGYGTQITVPDCDFTNSHASFVNWNTLADGTGTAYAPGQKFTIKSDVTLYAQWKYEGVTYELSSSATGKIVIADGEAPEGSQVTYTQTNTGNLGQFTSTNPDAKLVLSGFGGKLITGVTMKMHTNKSGGAGSITVTVSGTTVCSTTYAESFGDFDNTTAWRIASLVGFQKAYVQPNTNVVIDWLASDNSLYLESVTVNYIDVDNKRDLSGISTVCLPYAVAEGDYYGATFYEVAYLQRVDGTPYKIFFDEVTELVAGMPYLMVPNEDATQAAFIYSGTKATEGLSHNGMIGKLVNPNNSGYWMITTTENPDNRYYFVYQNEIRLCGQYNAIYDNRAYFDVTSGIGDSYMPQDYVAPAPGRRRVSLGNPAAAPSVTTGMDGVEAVETIQKVMIGNKIFILRGEKMYSIDGKLVK